MNFDGTETGNNPDFFDENEHLNNDCSNDAHVQKKYAQILLKPGRATGRPEEN